MSDDVLIRVDGVSKKFCRDLKRSLWYGVQDTVGDLLGSGGSQKELRRDEFWAVRDVSFELKRGECLGLIGHNGAGKTTLLKMLNGLIKPDCGRIEMRGRVGALIALGAGFNPVLTGRENVYVNGSVLGLRKQEIDDKFEEIIDFAEIGEFIDSPVQNYSSGMQIRLGFAIATAIHPDVLLLDEVLAVGDTNFQAKCYDRIGVILETAAVVLVSHQPHHIRRICDWVILLHKGKKFAAGFSDEILSKYSTLTSHASSERLVILGDGVTSVELASAPDFLNSGDFLVLWLKLSLFTTIQCDQVYISIIDRVGTVHAQIMANELAGTLLDSGISLLTIRIGPLHLSNGSFEGHVMMWTSGGKKTLIQLRHVFKFECRGPISLGPVYYPPASISVESGDCATDYQSSKSNSVPQTSPDE
jgi:lipopolysaccharide transport system ATP-binding protein